MNTDSYLLVEVPRSPSISALSNKCFPEYAARNIYPPDHLHLFTDKSIDTMLPKFGLKIEHVWFFGQDVYEILTTCMLHGGFEDHPLIDKTLNIVDEFQAVVDKNNLSDTMLVLSRKVKGE